MRAQVDFDVPAVMRDGVVLRATVYRPEGAGPWPVLLARTPYDKDSLEAVAEMMDPLRAVRAGFIVVIQGTRGRFSSSGDWAPFAHEHDDGYDTVEWAAGLPGSNGRVGMFGGSYVGSTQWLAAISRPPSLHAIAPAVTWADPMDGLFARGGAVELGLAASWDIGHGVAWKLRDDDPARHRVVEDMLDDFDALAEDGVWGLPVKDLPVVRKYGLPDVGALDVLRDPRVAGACMVAGRHSEVEVPALNTGGWYDLMLQGTIDNHVALTALGRPSRLVIGPWTHRSMSDPVGQLVFGARSRRFEGWAPAGQPNLDEDQLDWFRRWLAPRPGASPVSEADAPAAVRIFVMGTNVWRDEPEWPLRRATTRRFYLHSDGELSGAVPAAGQPPASFEHDPDNPVPTVGGATVLPREFPSGPFDQRGIEARPDVLTYTSDPLEDDMEVTGRVHAFICGESTAPSADWVVRLCDVHPDGRSFNVCDGIVRVAAAPGSVTHRVDLWSTSIVFLRGHRLRLHVAGSSFPRWDRNLGTGRQDLAGTRPAVQRVHQSQELPSYIELPVVP